MADPMNPSTLSARREFYADLLQLTLQVLGLVAFCVACGMIL